MPHALQNQKLIRLSTFLIFIASLGSTQTKKPAPPVARQDNVKEMIHGVEIVDPYRWLEDQQSPETRKWLQQEDAYTHSALDGLAVRERAFQRLWAMANHDSMGAPYIENGYYFFSRRGAGQDLSKVYRRKGADGEDELLLNPLPFSPDHTTSIGSYIASQDARLMIYSIRRGGEDETELHILDLQTHHELSDVMPRGFYLNVNWKKDASGFFYSKSDRETGKRIYYHQLGTNAASDVELFGKGYGPDTWINPIASRDGRYLLALVSKGWASDEIYIKNLEPENSEFHPLITALNSHFNVEFAGDFLIVDTDWQAPRHRILKIDLHHPERDHWQEIVPEQKDAIQGFSLVGDRLFVNYLHNVTTQISIFSLDGKALGKVELPSAGSAQIYGRFGEDEGGLAFNSYTVPYSIYRYFASSGTRTLWFRNPVPFDSDRYTTEQVWYKSKDGT